MLSLDGDRIDTDFLDGFEENMPFASALYTTHSSTAENPRVRIVAPLTRDVSPEEFAAVSRYIAQMLGIDYFDECSCVWGKRTLKQDAEEQGSEL